MEFPDIKELLLSKPPQERAYGAYLRVECAIADTMRAIAADMESAQELPWKLSSKVDSSVEPHRMSLTVTQGETRVLLDQLLAHGFHFQPGYGAYGARGRAGDALLNISRSAECDYRERTVELSALDVAEPEAFPVILHEIGHTHHEEPQDPLELWQNRSSANIRWWTHFLWSMRRADMRSVWYVPIEGHYPRRYIDELHAGEDRDEQRAWQRATEIMHQLEREGIDVWSAFPEDTFADCADIALHSKDAARYYDLYVHGGKRALERAEPLYLKERGMYGKGKVRK